MRLMLTRHRGRCMGLICLFRWCLVFCLHFHQALAGCSSHWLSPIRQGRLAIDVDLPCLFFVWFGWSAVHLERAVQHTYELVHFLDCPVSWSKLNSLIQVHLTLFTVSWWMVQIIKSNFRVLLNWCHKVHSKTMHIVNYLFKVTTQFQAGSHSFQ